MAEALKFAIFGTGFWANFQLAAWKELKGVQCVAAYNRTISKAQTLASKFGIANIYDDAEKLMKNEKLDFIDIITNVETHCQFVELAAKHKVPVICQKPMGTTLKEAEYMVDLCRKSNTPLYIHENWRWQTPIMEFKKLLDSGVIGTPFRARLTMASGFPVFKNQPFLKELEQFILTDLGSHILDAARFMFGEAKSLYCHTQKVHKDIKGEDVATVMMKMGDNDVSVLCEMAYAENHLERDAFPQTFAFVEGSKGSLELEKDYRIRITTESGTKIIDVPPPVYAWADPKYAVVHSSIVPCNADILQDLQGKGKASTTGEDNLKTVRLVFSSYDSAHSGKSIEF